MMAHRSLPSRAVPSASIASKAHPWLDPFLKEQPHKSANTSPLSTSQPKLASSSTSFLTRVPRLHRSSAQNAPAARPFYNYPINAHAGRESLNGTPTPRTASPAQPAPGSSGTVTTASSAYSQGLGGTHTSSSPFALAGISRHRDYPTLPSNVENLVALPSQLSLPFIKRSQEEDVEPCLRLDFAPGLNWLSRRQANTAILDGNLVIEPIFSGSKTIDEELIRKENAHLPPAACAMCGIPVVNVPLPGGVAATALSAEQGGKTSLVPAASQQQHQAGLVQQQARSAPSQAAAAIPQAIRTQSGPKHHEVACSVRLGGPLLTSRKWMLTPVPPLRERTRRSRSQRLKRRSLLHTCLCPRTSSASTRVHPPVTCFARTTACCVYVPFASTGALFATLSAPSCLRASS